MNASMRSKILRVVLLVFLRQLCHREAHMPVVRYVSSSIVHLLGMGLDAVFRLAGISSYCGFSLLALNYALFILYCSDFYFLAKFLKILKRNERQSLHNMYARACDDILSVFL